jgi:leader peptidase (prepilin peptidase)/N-methyltransferase
MFHAIYDSNNWASVPFHFWSVVFFVFGCMVGSFLNVCIHRMPRGESIVSPPSHCPHCGYAIPWYLNIPLVTWLWLRGRCRNCGAPIAPRYFLVELLTGLMFLSSWLAFGHRSAALALVYCVFLAGLIAATFIDFEHFIIPDEITLGGVMVGVVCSFFLPRLQDRANMTESVFKSLLGVGVGAGVVYLVLRLGKWLFGRHRLPMPPGSKVVFTETELHLPDRVIPYEELFYRRSDTVVLQAQTVELVDRCYREVEVRLTPERLRIGDEEMNPVEVPHMELACEEIVLPREAMGLGDVKFMAGIGAFLGWQAVIFSLMLSSMIGSVVGVALIVLRKREWSSRIPYGPYIALAAVIWIFWGPRILSAFFGG